MLNHVQNSQAGRNAWEVHTDSLFKVTFIPPSGVQGAEILTEQVTNVTGWKMNGPEAIQQTFNQAKRNYASVDSDNTQVITIEFELNLNDNLQNYVYNTIVDWRKLVFNPLTGERGLKANYIGTIIVESYAANGDIYWTRTLKNIWPSGDLDSIGQNDVTAADPTKLSTTWTGDWYDEVKR